MNISTRDLATASFIGSALVFFLAIFLGSITVHSAQPNGLAQVSEPYSAFGFYGLIASGGLLLFGITLLYAGLKGSAERKRLLGNTLLSSGIIAVLVGGFVIWTDLLDEGPRCLNGCAASLLSYYREVYSSMALLIGFGFVAAFLGALQLKRGSSGADKDGVSKNQNVAFPDQE